MPLRHKVYSKHSVAAVTPEKLLKHLEILDFLTLGEDYNISPEAVHVALPLRIKNIRPGPFLLYHISYGKSDKRPIEINRWETEDQRRASVDETIDNLAIAASGHESRRLMNSCAHGRWRDVRHRSACRDVAWEVALFRGRSSTALPRLTTANG